MNKLRFLYVLSFLITVLFCWVIYPYKWVNIFIFKRRKRIAIKKANKRALTTPEPVYVIQIKNRFIVGIRSELKKYDKRFREYLKIKSKDSKIWDYRNAIIYKTK